MELIYQNLNHVFCALLFIGRLGDIVSTYIVTPKLKLEANPIVRKFKYPFAFATIFVCVVPYWNLGFGLALIVASYLISFLNISKMWFLKTLGEEDAFKLYIYIAQKSSLKLAISLSILACSFLAAIGFICLLFYPHTSDWGFYFGIGIVGFALAIQIHTIFYFKRIFRTAEIDIYKLNIERE
jgi:hypothetical protein